MAVAGVVLALMGRRGGAQGADVNGGGPHGARADTSPIYSPAESIARMRIDPRFRVELVAAEPMVEAPVAISYDEDGKMWVVEMRAFMRDAEGKGELEASGRIAVLEDSDGDGVMDKRTVFMDGLVLPRAVAPCHGGALVIAPPNLIFAQDTDGDGKADTQTILMTGLAGLESPEHAANGVVYGLDNWWHLAQHGAELKVDGTRAQVRATPVVGQWGVTQDERGRLYYTPNSEALRMDMFPKHYAARNPAARDLPGINRLASPDQTVWPGHPTPGVNRAYMEHVLRADGTLASHTAACGPSLYFAGLFPQECVGNAFVCEPAANMVRRLTVTEGKDGPVARNAYDHGEFLTSPDERFRPVNTAVGPDGALYVVDMHRGVIQHKLFLTPYLKEQIKTRGLESPLHLGRIYRVVPVNSAPAAKPAERLSKTTDEELVRLLDSTDLWHATTAQRLLIERRARAAAPSVRERAAHAERWQSRLRALWTLEGLGELAPADVEMAMHDVEPPVRAAAIRLSERFPDAYPLGQLATVLRDPDPDVRRQAALSIGERPEAARVQLFAECVAANPTDEVMHSCVLSGARGVERELMGETIARGVEKPGWHALAERLTSSLLNSDSADDRVWLLDRAAGSADNNPTQARLLLGLVERKVQPKAKSPHIVRLARAPEGWEDLAARRDDLGVLARSLGECLDWPGRPSPVAAKQPRALNTQERALFERGERVYSLCYSCHAADGLGTPGQAPPLSGSALAQGPPGVPVRIVLQGLEASTIGSGTYPVMPPVPINDESIAAVLTYVRRAWSNSADPILPAFVHQIREETRDRKTPWRRDELEHVK